MKTELVPLKIKDTESISWAKGLINYLKRSYGSSQWSVFYDADSTKELDACRTSANSDLAPESLLQQNYRYAAVLEQVYLRLGDQSSSLQIEFTWYEADYGSGNSDKKFSQRTVVFEKSSVMFNVAVLLKQIALKKMSENYKSAIPYLGKAVACFQYMSHNFLNSPSADCAAETTSFLSTLTHAEAQEMFLLTLINGPDASKRASLISKLAHTAANLYEECQKFYEKEERVSFSFTAYGEERWSYLISIKFHLYRAITAYNHLIVLEESHKIGEAIAYGKIALSEIKEAIIEGSYIKSDIELTGLKSVIDEKLKSVIKDNDFIYNETIPADATLESIKTMDAIKPVPWEEQLKTFMTEVTDFCNAALKGIVPMEVYENESIYSEEKASLLRGEVDRVNTADWEYQSFMEFTELPKLIKNLEEKYLKNGNNTLEDPQYDLMFQQVSSWASSIRSNKLRNVNEQIQMISNKRNEILSLLSTLSPDQRDNTLKIKNSLVQASQSDDKIFASVRPYLSEINLLSSPELLSTVIPKFKIQSNEPSLLDIDDNKNEQVLKCLADLRDSSETLRLLKEERSRNLKELKEKLNDDDISQKLIVSTGRSKKDIKGLFECELNKFTPLTSRIDATIFKQSNLINDMKTKLDNIFKLTGSQKELPQEKALMDERQEFLERLEKSYTQFVTYSSDLQKGLNFYDSLLKMTRELASQISPAQPSSNSTESAILPPVLPQKSTQSTTFTESFGNLSLHDKLDNSVPRNGSSTKVPGNNLTELGAPQVPPKFPSTGIATLMDNQKPEDSPTSFYNNPSVFDDTLYSKFS